MAKDTAGSPSSSRIGALDLVFQTQNGCWIAALLILSQGKTAVIKPGHLGEACQIFFKLSCSGNLVEDNRGAEGRRTGRGLRDPVVESSLPMLTGLVVLVGSAPPPEQVWVLTVHRGVCPPLIHSVGEQRLSQWLMPTAVSGHPLTARDK